jgi:hypothetical protein
MSTIIHDNKKIKEQLFFQAISLYTNNSKIKKILNTSFMKSLILIFVDLDKSISDSGFLNKDYLKSKFYIKILKKFLDIIKFFRKPSPKYIKYFALNLLGFQIFRILYFLLRSNFRKFNFYFQSSATREILLNFKFFDRIDFINIIENGFLIKHNFINKSQANSLIKLFEYNRDKHLIINRNNHNTKKLELFKLDNLPDFVIEKEKELRSFVCLLLNIKLVLKPAEIAIFEDYYENYEYNVSDHQDSPHGDVPYDTFKAFIYLDETNNENGAFCYLPKTHKITFRRLIADYIGSLNLLNNQDNWSKNWPYMLYKKFKINSCDGSAGSLVLANTCGYHARGPFKKANKKRFILYFNYRYLN